MNWLHYYEAFWIYVRTANTRERSVDTGVNVFRYGETVDRFKYSALFDISTSFVSSGGVSIDAELIDVLCDRVVCGIGVGGRGLLGGAA